MTPRIVPTVFVCTLLTVLTVSAAPADSASGTFTVAGKTTRFTEAYATLERDPVEASQQYLMVILADAPVKPDDRTPAGLMMLAQAGRVHALRIRWTYGTDTFTVTPYHQGIPASGRSFRQMATMNITKLDDRNIEAEFRSKSLGQAWQFNAGVKAVVTKGSVAQLEPDADPAADAPAPAAGATTGSAGASAALKRQLGSMGYEFKPDAFFQAIGDRNVAAVELFLQAGMSPNLKNDQGRYALNHAVLFCGADAAKASAVIVALVRGKGDVKSRDPDNKTTPLVGAVQSCTVDAIDALIKAGSDLTAKSAGGTTALQLADIYQRADIAALLRKAGAK